MTTSWSEHSQPRPFSEQIIWLTGASSGIGEALVHALQAECRHLIISARNAQALQELAERYNNVSIQVADITNASQMLAAAAAIKAQFGYIDTLIANAGTCEYVDVDQFDSALIRRVIDTNFFGLINTVEAALPLLQKSPRGYIAGMSSSVTWLAMPRAQAYGASKAAVRHFLECMQADLKHKGVDVGIISPGFVQTPLTDRNDFPMPGKIDAEEAAIIIIKGLKRRQLEIRFPFLFTLILRIIGALPARLRLKITSAMARNNQQPDTGDRHS
ncbi:MAG: SDR family NAD(P)-dependent oxidoreductase [Saccharospirillaceae bacterium]|nr:SDR family NAD(P)-dependent oxidoreductase [Saccharospirillaceae bacterium]MCD8532679.1 SDR family NAD(P)-dependent oxidoreductase [Saccharospirillaceae bacterium]